MAYLSREARRDQIMNAVVDLVTRESLSAATVRRIAQETGCSLGQIHHHFASADALRAEAVRAVWAILDPQLQAALMQLEPRKRLITLLSSDPQLVSQDSAALLGVARRLWKEAWDIRHQEAVKVAVAEGFARIREVITLTLQDGVASGEFPAHAADDVVVLRLMAASQGYDLLLEMGMFDHQPDCKPNYIKDLLAREGI